MLPFMCALDAENSYQDGKNGIVHAVVKMHKGITTAKRISSINAVNVPPVERLLNILGQTLATVAMRVNKPNNAKGTLRKF